MLMINLFYSGRARFLAVGCSLLGLGPLVGCDPGVATQAGRDRQECPAAGPAQAHPQDIAEEGGASDPEVDQGSILIAAIHLCPTVERVAGPLSVVPSIPSKSRHKHAESETVRLSRVEASPLIELLVVIAIIAVPIALLLLAVQAARQGGKRPDGPSAQTT